ncbi:MAG: porphobilinogen synthase [Candidatus Methanosuratincola sp.]|uniref:Delta-aminolevulinic acid dehydratase n=1 Tax=Methanosuratincola subterraneus TaxID=2593994 RepID=A0A444L9A6_METS7|nr:MAG: Porphobilinogen synthase [Candidatus Methanosuratincola subterraneus]
MDARITSRLRKSYVLRDLACESDLNPSKFIMPVFVKESGEIERSRWGGMEKVPLKALVSYLEPLADAGIRSVLMFGLPCSKDPSGSSAYAAEGVVQQAIRAAKGSFPEIAVLTDVCLCQYTDHGHCGILEGESISREKTLSALSKIAVSHAEAGADVVAPSAMADGQVASIRAALDASGYDSVAIMSYSAKYCSSLYAPFRDVASSAPSFGDRSAYQMDIRNRREAIAEALEDIREGADIVMVKPAITNLDVIRDLRKRLLCPIAAYQVSGEYAMIKVYSDAAGVSEARVVLEMLRSIRRAGADMIITYFAPQTIAYLREVWD